MANFIVTYDLNGPTPSHREMDNRLSQLGAKSGRVLETVWWVDWPGSAVALHNHLHTILGKEDSLLVTECTSAAWSNLLVDSRALEVAWERAS